MPTEPTLTTREAITVVGVDLEAAGEDPGLIVYGWMALAVRKHEIPNQVRPYVLYGVWHHKTEGHRYLVGVQVSSAENLPTGLTAVTLPAGQYAALTHRGNIGRIGETYASFRTWIPRSGCDGLTTATFEEYDTTRPVTGDYTFLIYEPVREL